MIPLGGLEIRVCEWMAGMKKAAKQGNVVYVSPAMCALMKDATSAELEHLFRCIKVVDLGPPPDFSNLPMIMPGGFLFDTEPPR